jgi:hypothetical protein
VRHPRNSRKGVYGTPFPALPVSRFDVDRNETPAAAKLKVMGVQKGWPDFLFFAPAGDNTPAGLMHALELERRGEEMTEEQEAFAGWCKEQGIPFACTVVLGEALAILSSWGVLRRPVAGLGRIGR